MKRRPGKSRYAERPHLRNREPTAPGRHIGPTTGIFWTEREPRNTRKARNEWTWVAAFRVFGVFRGSLRPVLPLDFMSDPSTLPARRPRLRWFRFSLRTLLIVAPLTAILIGFVGVRWYRSYVESQAIQAVQSLGGTIQRDKDGNIVLVEIPGDKLTDESLAPLVRHLAQLPTLETLILHGPFVTDGGLKPLAQLTTLKRLHLINMDVSSGGVAALRKNRPQLEVAQSSLSPTASKLVARNIYDHALLHVAFSANQQLLVTGRASGQLEFWDIASGETVWSTKAHDEWLFSLALHPQRRILATAGGDNMVRLWDLALRKPIVELEGHDDDVHAVAFTPDGKRLISASDDYTLRIWDVASRKTLHVLQGHDDTIPGLAVSPDGRTIASASRDDTIRLWDAITGEQLAVLAGHGNDVMSVAFSPDGALLASGSYDKMVTIWDVNSHSSVQVLPGADDWIFAVSFSPDGRRVAAGSADGLRVWNLPSGQLHLAIADVRLISSLAYDASGNRLAATSAEGTIHLWDARSGQRLATLGNGYCERDEMPFLATAE